MVDWRIIRAISVSVAGIIFCLVVQSCIRAMDYPDVTGPFLIPWVVAFLIGMGSAITMLWAIIALICSDVVLVLVRRFYK